MRKTYTNNEIDVHRRFFDSTPAKAIKSGTSGEFFLFSDVSYLVVSIHLNSQFCVFDPDDLIGCAMSVMFRSLSSPEGEAEVYLVSDGASEALAFSDTCIVSQIATLPLSKAASLGDGDYSLAVDLLATALQGYIKGSARHFEVALRMSCPTGFYVYAEELSFQYYRYYPFARLDYIIRPYFTPSNQPHVASLGGSGSLSVDLFSRRFTYSYPIGGLLYGSRGFEYRLICRTDRSNGQAVWTDNLDYRVLIETDGEGTSVTAIDPLGDSVTFAEMTKAEVASRLGVDPSSLSDQDQHYAANDNLSCIAIGPAGVRRVYKDGHYEAFLKPSGSDSHRLSTIFWSAAELVTVLRDSSGAVLRINNAQGNAIEVGPIAGGAVEYGIKRLADEGQRDAGRVVVTRSGGLVIAAARYGPSRQTPCLQTAFAYSGGGLSSVSGSDGASLSIEPAAGGLISGYLIGEALQGDAREHVTFALDSGALLVGSSRGIGARHYFDRAGTLVSSVDDNGVLTCPAKADTEYYYGVLASGEGVSLPARMPAIPLRRLEEAISDPFWSKDSSGCTLSRSFDSPLGCASLRVALAGGSAESRCFLSCAARLSPGAHSLSLLAKGLAAPSGSSWGACEVAISVVCDVPSGCCAYSAQMDLSLPGWKRYSVGGISVPQGATYASASVEIRLRGKGVVALLDSVSLDGDEAPIPSSDPILPNGDLRAGSQGWALTNASLTSYSGGEFRFPGLGGSEISLGASSSRSLASAVREFPGWRGDSFCLVCCYKMAQTGNDDVSASVSIAYLDGTSETVSLPLLGNPGRYQTVAKAFTLLKPCSSFTVSASCLSPSGCRIALLQVYRYGRVGARADYDEWGKPISAKGIGGETLLSYDSRGNPAASYDPSGACERRIFDASNRLVSASDSATAASSVAYDGPLRVGSALRHITGPAASAAWSYVDGQLVAESTLGRSEGYSYSGEYLSALSEGGVAAAQFSYDAEGRLGSSQHGSLVGYSWGYGSGGRPSYARDSSGSDAIRYEYDSSYGWLTQVKSDGAPLSTFSRLATAGPLFGLLGGETVGGSSESYSYDYRGDGRLREVSFGGVSVSLHGQFDDGLSSAGSAEGYLSLSLPARFLSLEERWDGVEGTVAGRFASRGAFGPAPSASLSCGSRVFEADESPSPWPGGSPDCYFNRLTMFLGDEALMHGDGLSCLFGGQAASAVPGAQSQCLAEGRLGYFSFADNGARVQYPTSGMNSARAEDPIFGRGFDYTAWQAGLSSRRTIVLWIRPLGESYGSRRVAGFQRSLYGSVGHFYAGAGGSLSFEAGSATLSLGKMRKGEWNFAAATFWLEGSELHVLAALNGSRASAVDGSFQGSLADITMLVVGDFSSSLIDPDPYDDVTPHFPFDLAYLSVGCAPLGAADMARMYWEGDAALNRAPLPRCVSSSRAVELSDVAMGADCGDLRLSSGEGPASFPSAPPFSQGAGDCRVADSFGADQTGLPAFSPAPSSSPLFSGASGFLSYRLPGGPEYSFCFWFKPRIIGTGTLAAFKSDALPAPLFSVGFSSLNVVARWLTFESAICGASGLLGSWHFLAVSRSASGSFLTIDGATYQFPGSFAPPNGQASVSVGSFFGSSAFDGLIRGFAMSGSCLSAAEIAEVRAAGFGLIEDERSDVFGRPVSREFRLGALSLSESREYGDTPSAFSPLVSVERLLTGESVEYSYDARQRLTGRRVRSSSGSILRTESYEYDACGRIARYLVDGVQADSYSYDQAGRNNIASKGGRTYYYDPVRKDRLVGMSDGTAVAYGPSGMVASISRPGAQTRTFSWRGRELHSVNDMGFFYDSGGVRVKKRDQSGLSVEYRTAGGRLISLLHSSPSFEDEMLFDYGPGGRPVGFLFRGNRYLYVWDALGIIRGIVDMSGGVKVSYSYGPWGEPTASHASDGGTSQDIEEANPLLYKGYIYDPESGLYYLQSRYYDPSIGRFLSPDTVMAEAGEDLNVNLYAYCRNDPITFSDPTGHFAISAAILIGAGVLMATGIGLTIGGRLSGNEVLTNIGDSIISGAEIIGGAVLIATGVGGILGMGLLGTGIGSAVNGLVNWSNGGTYHAGWAGGQLSGALSLIPYVGGGLGAFFGSALTDLVDDKYDFSGIDWGKAAWSGAIAFGLSWFGNAVTWGGGKLSVAAQFALSYDYALIGLSNSVINVFWRGKKKW